MFTLIILIVFSLGFGYFATQNTQLITITLASYVIHDIPLYVVIGGTLLVGLFLSWLFNLRNSFFSSMKLSGKDSTIKNAQKTIHELTKEINQLEIENANLKGKIDKDEMDDDSI